MESGAEEKPRQLKGHFGSPMMGTIKNLYRRKFSAYTVGFVFLLTEVPSPFRMFQTSLSPNQLLPSCPHRPSFALKPAELWGPTRRLMASKSCFLQLGEFEQLIWGHSFEFI